MNDEQPRATDYVATWITAQRNEIGGTQLKFAWDEQHGRKFCAEFETPKYLIQFCAWDNGSCLDILALNKDSDETDYIMGGDCDGTEALMQRLDNFLHWLNLTDPYRNA